MLTIGVIADTHVPDRVRRLSPAALAVFHAAQVDAILHAGDVSSQGVLSELGEIAPVYAVQGNRDWFSLRRLPAQLQMEFGGIRLGMAHGHGGLWNYIKDWMQFLLYGLQWEVIETRMLAAFPEAEVLVFGHIHRPVNRWVGYKLLFNPGSAHITPESFAPSVGLLRIGGNGQVEGEIIYLE